MTGGHPQPQQQPQQQPPQPWWQPALHAAASHMQGLQQQLQRLHAPPPRPPPTPVHAAAAAARLQPPAQPPAAAPQQQPQQPQRSSQQQRPVTKEELGRATWTLLHTLAAQFPQHPTRQQQRDARTLVECLTRIYPCADCAQHFQQVVRAEPPEVSSGAALQAWMCRAHNAVNRRLGKPTFNCDVAGARWAPLDCGPSSACDLSVGMPPRSATWR